MRELEARRAGTGGGDGNGCACRGDGSAGIGGEERLLLFVFALTLAELVPSCETSGGGTVALAGSAPAGWSAIVCRQ